MRSDHSNLPQMMWVRPPCAQSAQTIFLCNNCPYHPQPFQCTFTDKIRSKSEENMPNPYNILEFENGPQKENNPVVLGGIGNTPFGPAWWIHERCFYKVLDFVVVMFTKADCVNAT